MSLQDKLIKLLSSSKYTPLNLDGLADTLDLNKRQTQELKELIPKLIDRGTLAKVKKDRFIIPKDADLISGIIKFKASGNATLFPDDASDPIDIYSIDTDVAFHGDHILARIFKKRPKARYNKGRKLPSKDEPETRAKVKRILQRARNTIVGTLQRGRTIHYVIPDDPRFVHDITVPNPSKTPLSPRPKANDKVIVQLLEWKHPHLNPEGEILRTLGPTHNPMVEYEALLHKHDLNPNFPESVLRDVRNTPKSVRQSDTKGRLDCRNLFTLTIDPDDAQDFDDALSLERLPNHRYRLGIHIADVASYVKSQSALDKEAQKRGNSTYLVGSVIPMLPKQLSNGICSLVEAEDRLTKSVFLEFDANGSIKSTQFANTVIRSNKRLTYHQAYAFMTKDSLTEIRKTPLPPAHQTGSIGKSLQDLSKKEMQEIKDTLRTLWSFAKTLRDNRMKKGSLDFDMPDVKIYVNPDGAADRIESIEYDESHQLIEEFMLAANEAVAKALHKAKMPFISRVHDDPDTEKLNDLRDTLETFSIKTGDLNQRKNVIKLLNKIRTHPQGYTLKIQFLRSLKQACYRASHDGHYGLYKQFYAHFTSPIRRYSDLIVHRIFDNYLLKIGCDTAPEKLRRSYKKGELDSLSQHLSVTEQKSTEAERESTKIKLLEFFEREWKKPKKTPFPAIITEVRNHGMFIELTESTAFGLVPTSSLKDDIYKINQDNNTLVGRRRGRTFSVGQVIYVIVDHVDRFKRQMDFKLAPSETKAPNYPKPKSSNNKKRASEKPKARPRKKRNK